MVILVFNTRAKLMIPHHKTLLLDAQSTHDHPRPFEILRRSYEAELELAEAEVTCGHLTAAGYEILWRAAQLEQSALRAKIGLLERQCRLRKLRRSGRL